MRDRHEKRDERVEHLATVIQKIAYLEKMNEIRGASRYRTAEIVGMTWMIETLQQLDPALAPLVTIAEALAEDRLSKAPPITWSAR